MHIAVQPPNKPGSCYPGYINKQEEHNHCSAGAHSPGNSGSHAVVRNRHILINSLPFELNKNLRYIEMQCTQNE